MNKRSSAHRALEHAAQTAAAAVLRRRGHLDAGGHPGQLARLREDRLAGVERQLEDRHGGADDLLVHVVHSQGRDGSARL
jgi:hypothetical protein